MISRWMDGGTGQGGPFGPRSWALVAEVAARPIGDCAEEKGEPAMKAVCTGAALVCVLFVASLPQASATTVYDNTVNPSGYFWPYPGVEFGDRITLGGTARFATEFTAYLVSINQGPVTTDLVVSLYANDGTLTVAGNAPGTVLFAELLPGVTLPPVAITILPVAIPYVLVPDTLTWTLWSSQPNLGPAGALIYDPPTVGSSNNFFWARSGGVWAHYYFGGYPVANFAARLEAEDSADGGAVPEPVTLIACALSLLGVGSYARRRGRPSQPAAA